MSIIKAVTKPVIHSFPKEYAIKLGENAALLLKFLAHKTRKSKNIRNGKSWYYDTFTDITKRFPYLSRSAVTRAIAKLTKAHLVEVGNYNKLKIDRTRWYHVPQPHRDAAEKTPISFDSAHAKEHGIIGAVLLRNLRHWLRLHAKDGRPLQQEMSPAKLHKVLTFFSVSSIKRKLKALEKAGMIVRMDPANPLYTLLNTSK